jgi:hypothetical protein
VVKKSEETSPKFVQISSCAASELFLIKPPFFPAPACGRLLNYGQTKEKEDFC